MQVGEPDEAAIGDARVTDLAVTAEQESRARLQESTAPLRGFASCWISHNWQRLGRYLKLRLRREATGGGGSGTVS
jgi:hypothetical protein